MPIYPTALERESKICFWDKEWKGFLSIDLHWKNNEELSVKKEIKSRVEWEKKNYGKKGSLVHKGKNIL